MVNWLVDQLLKVHGSVALLVVFLLPALEASVFLGFILPGETAVVVGGFLAYEGRISLAAALAAAALGAILGDSAGYEVGRKWGDWLLARAPKRFVKPVHVEQGKALINRLGGKAVFAGRWTAVLRALVPSLCGVSRMRYRSFLMWNALGGLTWAVAYTLIGYLAGNAWQRIEGYTNTVSYVLFGAALVAVVFFVVWHRRRQAARDADTEAAMAGATTQNTQSQSHADGGGHPAHEADE